VLPRQLNPAVVVVVVVDADMDMELDCMCCLPLYLCSWVGPSKVSQPQYCIQDISPPRLDTTHEEIHLATMVSVVPKIPRVFSDLDSQTVILCLCFYQHMHTRMQQVRNVKYVVQCAVLTLVDATNATLHDKCDIACNKCGKCGAHVAIRTC
jgi:hypothetical protein